MLRLALRYANGGIALAQRLPALRVSDGGDEAAHAVGVGERAEIPVPWAQAVRRRVRQSTSSFGGAYQITRVSSNYPITRQTRTSHVPPDFIFAG